MLSRVVPLQISPIGEHAQRSIINAQLNGTRTAAELGDMGAVQERQALRLARQQSPQSLVSAGALPGGASSYSPQTITRISPKLH